MFPEKIFDGTHMMRPDLNACRHPEFFDYVILSNELGAVQKFVKDLAQNLDTMPDLQGALDDAKDRIETVKSLMLSVTPPQDLKDRLEEIAKQVSEVDSRTKVLGLQRELETLRREILDNQLQMLQITQPLQDEFRGFKNQVWSTLTKLSTNVEERLANLEQQMTQTNAAVDITRLLSKLK